MCPTRQRAAGAACTTDLQVLGSFRERRDVANKLQARLGKLLKVLVRHAGSHSSSRGESVVQTLAASAASCTDGAGSRRQLRFAGVHNLRTRHKIGATAGYKPAPLRA